MPKFSIICADYEKYVPRDDMRSGLASVFSQTFQDFEVLICHDGPKEVPYSVEIADVDRIRFLSLAQRVGDKGHAARNHAMQVAAGEWFLHFNLDNILYPRCLERLDAFSQTVPEKIIIYTIWHRKLRAPEFRGVLPKVGNIDLLQLVAHRDIWANYRFEGDDRHADGICYEAMCKRHPYAVLPERLAENF